MKIAEAARMLRAHSPLAYRELVKFIEETQAEADTILRSAIREELLRQAQGKSQLCEHLLEILKS
jgi:hypothetical protein